MAELVAPPPPAGMSLTPPPPPAGMSEAPPISSSGPAAPAGLSEAPSEYTPSKYGFGIKPAKTHTGADSVQREGDNGVWYGPEQGNKGKDGWFDEKGQRLGDMPAGMKAPTPQVGPGMRRLGNESIFKHASPLVGLTLALGDYFSGGMTANPTNAGVVKGLAGNVIGPAQSVAHRLPGPSPVMDRVAQNSEDFFRENFKQDRAGEALGAVAPFLMTGGRSGVAQTVSQYPSLAALGKLGVTTGIGALMAPLMTPEADLKGPDDYSTRKKTEAVIGGGMGFLMGAYPAVKTLLNPPIEFTGNPLSPNPMNRGSNPPAGSIPKLQRLATEGNPEAIKALEQVRLAASKEHGIPVTRADINADPIARATEEGLGAKTTAFRTRQAQAISRSVKKAETTASEALAGKDASLAIQEDVAVVYSRNRATSRQNYNELYGDVAAADQAHIAQGNPSANRVNRDAAVAEIDRILAEETPKPGVVAELQRIKTHLTNPTKPLDFKTAKGLVSNTEGVARDLGLGSVASPADSNGARLLSGVSRKLDAAADETATALLGSADKVKAASDFHRTNVIPFHDPATGLPQILDGPYSDKATKVFLQTASPDQIAALAARLGEQGQAGLKAKLLEAARQAGEKGLGGTRGFLPGQWGDFLAKHSTALESVLSPAELRSLQSLVHLSQSTMAGQAANPAVGNGMTRRLIGAVTGHGIGGPLGAPVGAALEHGAEAGIQAARAPGKLNPTIVSNTPKDKVLRYMDKITRTPPASQRPGAVKPPATPKAQAERELTQSHFRGEHKVHSIDTKAEFDALPNGAVYRDSNGKIAIKTDLPKKRNSDHEARLADLWKGKKK